MPTPAEFALLDQIARQVALETDQATRVTAALPYEEWLELNRRDLNQQILFRLHHNQRVGEKALRLGDEFLDVLAQRAV